MNIAAIGFLVLAGMAGGMNYYLRIKPRQNAEYRAYITKLSNDAMEMRREEETKKLNELVEKINDSTKKSLQLTESMRQSKERGLATQKMIQEMQGMKSGIDDLRKLPPRIEVK
ncbi:MAG: hypothetical protein ABL974_05395 [Prosthecobacter sp.]